MSCLISKFDQFTLNSDDDEEKVLYGYIFKAKSSKKFFACKNDFYVIPDFLDSRMLLCQRKYVTSDNCVITELFVHSVKNIGSPLGLETSSPTPPFEYQ